MNRSKEYEQAHEILDAMIFRCRRNLTLGDRYGLQADIEWLDFLLAGLEGDEENWWKTGTNRKTRKVAV